MHETESNSDLDFFLESRKPYLHYTNQGVAVRSLVDGLFSYAFAKKSGNDQLMRENRYQGDHSISVTDVNKYKSTTQTEKPIVEIYNHALGLDDPDSNDIFHTGGICFLISNQVETIDDSSTGYSDKGHFSGGMKGEVVAKNRIAPRKIEGIVFTPYYKDDGNILDVLEEKNKSDLINQSPSLTYHQELMLLSSFKQLNAEVLTSLDQLEKQYKKIDDIRHTLDPWSFSMMIMGTEMNEGEKLSEAISRLRSSGKDFLADTLQKIFEAQNNQNPVQKDFESLLRSFQELLKEKLETSILQLPESARTYKGLIKALAEKRGIKVFDKLGTSQSH